MASADSPAVSAVRIMRLWDRRTGALIGVQAEQTSSQRFFAVIESVLRNEAIPSTVRDSVRQQFEAAINEGADPFFTLTLTEMEELLTGMRALRLNVDEEYSELIKIKHGLEQMSQRNRADEAKLRADASYRPEIQDTMKEFRDDAEVTKRAQQLWLRIAARLRDVLTVMAQTAPPSSRELVEAFTGDP